MENPFEKIMIELNQINKRLAELEILLTKEKTIENKVQFINRKEVCELLNIGQMTLYGYVSKKLIPYYKFGRELQFDKQEIIDWIKSTRRQTFKEIEFQAENYIKRTNNHR
jgi:excisionase family DNA binding protein